jgi:hypothetical protein
VLAGIPVWWALGLVDYAFVVLSLPMLGRMYSWARNGRRIRVPPGFGLWLMFLLITLISVATLSLKAPDTVVSPLSHRAISFIIRFAQYGGATVVLLYAGNLTERELPRRRLAWLLGLVVIYATIGGIGGTVAPHFHLTSPLAYVLPQSIVNSGLSASITHPALAEVQNLLGAPSGRPDAPFNYTNIWGSVVVMLVPWLLVGWWWNGTRRQRRIAVLTLIALLIPFLYSLNRGAWIGAIVAICYFAVRFAARGKVKLLAVLIVLLAGVAIAVTATPLQNVITQRLQNGKSNGIRYSQAVIALKDAEASPFIGYGDTRHMVGSPGSIAVGPTPNCHGCGQFAIGSNGQLWMLFICTGFLGASLYLGFFAYGVWRFRRDTTPYGMVGVLVLLLSFAFMFAYDSVGAPLVLIMCSYVLLWRNDRELGMQAGKPRRAIAMPDAESVPAGELSGGNGAMTSLAVPAHLTWMASGD